MTVNIEKSTAIGEIFAPKSKSAAHRMLISAAICSKKITVFGIENCDDVTATVGALKAIGCDIEYSADTAVINGITPVKEATVDCRESGSTLRFMIPICIALGIKVTFTGSERLFKRPLSVYEDIAREHGIKFIRNEYSLSVDGSFKSTDFTLSGGVSSQFISGLIFALCLMGRGGRINIIPPIVSSPYIDMTVQSVNRFGFSAKRVGNEILFSSEKHDTQDTFTVEGDWSNASFTDALNLLGGNVKITGLDENSLQGDRIYREHFLKFSQKPKIDISQTPDLGPILLAMMAHFHGGTLTGTSALRLKESDRGEAMRNELLKFGCELQINDDSVTVPDVALHSPIETLDPHNDHRICMALAVLCTRYGGKISSAQCVNKSYPGFWDDLKTLGIEILEE